MPTPDALRCIAYKTRLEPNNEQRTFFERRVTTSRFVFNVGLREWQRQYEAGEKPSQYKLIKQFNAQKDVMCSWVRNVPYAVTESAFRNLGDAFKHFFRRLKQGENPGYPKFKLDHKSFQLRGTKIEHNRVRLSGIGLVKLSEYSYIPVTAEKYGTYTTISERAGHWYISVLAYEEKPAVVDDSVLVIGVDFGIKALVVCSDGTVFENPKPLRDAQRKLGRLNRELSRRKKGGANWHKTQAKLARAHARVANIRKHTLHQISHSLVVDKHPAVIAIEDLNVSGMLKNHKLAQAISDVGFAELRRQIEYKAQWHGVQVVVVDRWFPSSKTCSRCGWYDQKQTLADRIFICGGCGHKIDRDLNAAINLAALGQKAQMEPDCLGS